MLYIEVKKV